MELTLHSSVILGFARSTVIFGTEPNCLKTVCEISAWPDWQFSNIHFSNRNGHFPLLCRFAPSFYWTWLYDQYDVCLIRNRNGLPFVSIWVHNLCLVGSDYFYFLCCVFCLVLYPRFLIVQRFSLAFIIIIDASYQSIDLFKVCVHITYKG